MCFIIFPNEGLTLSQHNTLKVNFLLITQSPPALSALFISRLIYCGDSVRERYSLCPDRILLITDILTMTVAPCVGHTGQRNLIAYIGLDDALDRNREVVIVLFLYHLTLGQHMPLSLVIFRYQTCEPSSVTELLRENGPKAPEKIVSGASYVWLHSWMEEKLFFVSQWEAYFTWFAV